MSNKFLILVAILAAILVAAMLGYVKNAQSVSERTSYSYDDYDDYDDDDDDYKDDFDYYE